MRHVHARQVDRETREERCRMTIAFLTRFWFKAFAIATGVIVVAWLVGRIL